MRKRYLEGSDYEKKRSIAIKKRLRLTRSQESLGQREEQLSRMRTYIGDRLSQEGEEQRALRLSLIRDRLTRVKSNVLIV